MLTHWAFLSCSYLCRKPSVCRKEKNSEWTYNENQDCCCKNPFFIYTLSILFSPDNLPFC